MRIQIKDPKELNGKFYTAGIYEVPDSLLDEVKRKGITQLSGVSSVSNPEIKKEIPKIKKAGKRGRPKSKK